MFKEFVVSALILIIILLGINTPLVQQYVQQYQQYLTATRQRAFCAEVRDSSVLRDTTDLAIVKDCFYNPARY